MSKLQNKINTPANILTILRFVFSIPFFYFIWYASELGPIYAVITGIIIVITDLLDGYIARKRKEFTKFGYIVDPVIDKLIVDVALLIFVLRGYISSWWVILLFARDIFLGITSLIMLVKYKYSYKPIRTGKLTPLVWSAVMALIILDINTISNILLIIANIFVIISWIGYGKMWISKKNMESV